MILFTNRCYELQRRGKRTTSSDMTMRLYSSAICAILSSSARVNTFPTGLCGVFTTIIFVFGVTARLPIA